MTKGFTRLGMLAWDTEDCPSSTCQPDISLYQMKDDSVWIVFNGEIYNFEELRLILVTKGHQFKQRTDTEVIIHAYEEYGVDFLNQLRGMFAFALWDEKNNPFLCSGSRWNKAFLLYSTKQGILFASELQASLLMS